jgi:flagellar biosynthesis GTPase FlhF
VQSAQLTVARLAPHEDQWTDVILLGHSMGGLLSADIALAFRHRIVGVINFDVPFLGMHPGIIKAGLGSIFSPPPAPTDAIPEEPSEKRPSRMETFFNPKPSDPNFNPSFYNDVQLPVRKGWGNTLHWLNKHYSNGLRQATKGLVKSHFEFGSAMADYKELKDRYARVRALEEDDEATRKSANPGVASPPRIRFINYYTASTGRPKKPKPPKSPSPSRPSSRGSHSHDSDAGAVASASQPALSSTQSQRSVNSPRISVEMQEHRDNDIIPVSPQEPLSATSPVNSFPIRSSTGDTNTPPTLPEVPPIPQEPPYVDLMQFSDKQERKAAEKEHDKSLKEYQKAVKARNKAINERTKMEEKWEKQQEQRSKQEQETLQQPKSIQHSESTEDSHPSVEMHMGYEMRPEEAPEIQALDEDVGTMQLGDSTHDHNPNHPYGNYDFSRSAILNQASPDDQASMTDSSYTLATTDSNATPPPTPGAETQKKKKLGKFCMLPPKDSMGNNDPTWVRVFMKDMDEVTAHTSLFFVNETYERLVGDVGARVEEWIREADSMRVVREMQAYG